MIFFPDNKKCNYEIEEKKDCFDLEIERIKEEIEDGRER